MTPPRYGGDHEDLSQAMREVKALNAETDRLAAAEAKRTGATKQGAATDAMATSRTRELANARKEAARVAERARAVADVEVQATDASTAAIERNRRAREEAARVQRQAQALQRGAVSGARDPLFAQAHAMGIGGNPPSQYQLRRDLSVGQQRAARLQAAAEAGFKPSQEPRKARFPATRRLAAELNLERQEGALTQATAELTKARRRKSATDEERALLLEQRDAARMSREAAKSELQSAERAEAQSRARAVEDAQRRQRELKREPGTDLIRHPTDFGRRVPGPFGSERPARGVVAEGGPGMGRGTPGSALPGFMPPQFIAAQTNAINEHTAALDDQARAANEVRRQQLDRYYSQLDAQALKSAASTRQSGVSFGMASQAMTRHGALSSEFIQAAARGEASVREMGNQALVTAGKFGAWVTVGAGLYMVADAARQVGRGAIDAMSGVDQLNRVVNVTDREGAQKGFADLAGKFNVDISTSADAVYRMGQVFHDQEEATKAAESALLAYQAGGLGVEEGTKSLISITQAFGLTAQDLTTVFDQVNEAQNQFGATIPDIMAGLSKAGGSFRQAGGDLDYLLALMVAIQKATGRTGQEIGTGLARGVNQFNLPSHVAALEAQGVEVDPENFKKTIQNAMRRVSEGGAGVDVNAIANALLGNQYGRLLPAVLTNQKTLNEALVKTSPEVAEGSGARELANIMQQADQQVVAVGIHLQQIGEGMARAHLFDPLMAGLKALNGMLGLATSLLNLFNQLPDPLRQMVTYFGQAYLLLQGIRRIGVTDALAGTSLGFLANPDQRLKTYATRGLRDARDAAQDEHERARRMEYRRAVEHETAQQSAANYHPTLANAQRLPVDHPDRTLAEKRAASLVAAETKAERELARARTVSTGTQAVLLRSEEDLTAAQRLRGRELRSYLAASKIPIPQEIDRPSSAGTTVLTRGGQNFDLGTGRMDRVRAFAGAPTGLGPRSQRAVTAARVRLADTAARLESMGGEMQLLGRSGRALEKGADATIRAAGRATTFVGRATGSLRGAPAKLSGFITSLGLLDAALLAFVIGEAVDSLMDDLQSDLDTLDKATNRSQNSTRRMRDIQQRAKGIDDSAIPAGSGLRDAGVFLNDFFNPVELFTSTLPDAIKTGSYEHPVERRHRIENEAKAAAAAARARREMWAKQKDAGVPRMLMNSRDLVKDIDRDSELRRNGVIAQGEFDERMARHMEELKFLYDSNKKSRLKVQRAVAEARRGTGGEGYGDALKQLDAEGVQSEMSALGAQIGALGGSSKLFANLRMAYNAAVAKLGSEDDAESVQQLAQARSAFFGTIEQTARAELQSTLGGASNEDERRAAFSRARQLIQRNITQGAQERLRKSQERIEKNDGDIEAATGPQGLRSVKERGQVEARLRRLRARAENLKGAERRARTELRAAEREAERLLKDLDRQEFEDREQGRQIRLALSQARTPEEGQRAVLAVRSAQRSVRDAASTFGRNSREYQQALTTLLTAREQAAQATVARIESENSLLTARAGDDSVARARAGLQGARRIQGEMNANKGQFSDADRTNSLVAIIEANNELESALAQREEARLQMLASRSDDPRVAARFERVAAVRNLRRQTPGTQGFFEAQRRLNEARRSEVQANIDETGSEIEFEREMGRLSIGDAIARYHTLLDAKNLTRRQRRDILMRIKGLQDESESEASGFNLDVGSLKLPTAYDVRRAFDPVREQVRRQVQEATRAVVGTGPGGTRAPDRLAPARARMSVNESVSNMYDQRAQVQAVVNVYVTEKGDSAEVYRALDRILGTSVKAKARSTGRR